MQTRKPLGHVTKRTTTETKLYNLIAKIGNNTRKSNNNKNMKLKSNKLL